MTLRRVSLLLALGVGIAALYVGLGLDLNRGEAHSSPSVPAVILTVSVPHDAGVAFATAQIGKAYPACADLIELPGLYPVDPREPVPTVALPCTAEVAIVLPPGDR